MPTCVLLGDAPAAEHLHCQKCDRWVHRTWWEEGNSDLWVLLKCGTCWSRGSHPLEGVSRDNPNLLSAADVRRFKKE